MGEFTTQVGMDVHARSISCRAMDVRTGELWSTTVSGDGMEAALVEWLRKLPRPVRCAYESGCTGFALQRLLEGEGIRCDVVAVSTLPRSPKDKMHKDDKRDAGVLLREMCNPAGDASLVWVPGPEVEGARDLARAAWGATLEVKSAKQRVGSLLLRHGFVWNERTPTGRPKAVWGKEWREWARKADLGDPLSNRVRDEWMATVELLERREASLAGAVAEAAESPRWKPYVDALCRLKGVRTGTAFLAAAEFGDFSRFRNGRSVSRWAGCTPSEHSSGEGRRRGGITKEGNGHLRRALMEGASTLSRQTSRAKQARRGHEASAAVEEIALAANERLRLRYEHLRDAGKSANSAKVAVVSEQVRWMWAIGVQVDRELAAG